jgi:hypothetical protein
VDKTGKHGKRVKDASIRWKKAITCSEISLLDGILNFEWEAFS